MSDTPMEAAPFAEKAPDAPVRVLSEGLASWLLVSPLAILLAIFLVIPISVIVTVSFWGYNEWDFYPDFTFENYEYLLTSAVTFDTYVKTFSYVLMAWAFTAAIGFAVAYFLAFHVRSTVWQVALFLVCTVPFWTSNIIRMISWIPFLGRNGLANEVLLQAGLIETPLEFLLFSDFAVVLAFVHLYTLFMVVPIFNSMMRIDRSLIEAARDNGASPFQILTNVILPLSKPGLMIGSIFVVTLVMGDFITVRFMSGSQSASVGRIIQNEIALLQYPAAAASAVVLLITVLIMIAVMLRLVDIRKEL
ncbi:putative spermidine/putrescine transport system permease protein [Albimonas donghaensis]|uniref:Putative spermidine/putrescine transport system permease protein n=2 Tax=Albimonas donghaensis TaxID=356660 RepID=A0A1H3CJ37_9RHOB|nr:ABC transporter permease [Albimonas donghaensis]SDX53499.1 putative spermidine/putrescine transport system permease protein [Albimonas donghaensis]